MSRRVNIHWAKAQCMLTPWVGRLGLMDDQQGFWGFVLHSSTCQILLRGSLLVEGGQRTFFSTMLFVIPSCRSKENYEDCSNIIKMAIFPKFNLITIKIPAGFFCRNRKTDSKIHMEIKGLRVAKQSWERKQSWTNHTSWFQNLLQSYSNQDGVVLA